MREMHGDLKSHCSPLTKFREVVGGSSLGAVLFGCPGKAGHGQTQHGDALFHTACPVLFCSPNRE